MNDEGKEDDRLTYEDVARICVGFATTAFNGMERQRILVVLPPGLEYIVAFLSCLIAGAIPVPVYPAASFDSAMARMNDIATDSGARVVCTDKSIYRALRAGQLFSKSPFKISTFKHVFVPTAWSLKVRFKTILKPTYIPKSKSIGKKPCTY